MTYVLSDLHGRLDLWNKALLKIKCSDDEYQIYVLGDVLDKGDKPIELLREIMKNHRVTMINGNHEIDFLKNYKLAHKSNRTFLEIAVYNDYLKNGGEPTIRQFFKCSESDQRAIVNFLRSNRFYAEVECNDKKFVLAHGGISNFSEKKSIQDYTPEELTLHRYKNNEKLFDDKILICGHTPTISSDFKTPAEIFVSKNGDFFNIDCGCVFPEYGGRLAVLTLETLQVNYLN